MLKTYLTLSITFYHNEAIQEEKENFTTLIPNRLTIGLFHSREITEGTRQEIFRRVAKTRSPFV